MESSLVFSLSLSFFLSLFLFLFLSLSLSFSSSLISILTTVFFCSLSLPSKERHSCWFNLLTFILFSFCVFIFHSLASAQDDKKVNSSSFRCKKSMSPPVASDSILQIYPESFVVDPYYEVPLDLLEGKGSGRQSGGFHDQMKKQETHETEEEESIIYVWRWISSVFIWQNGRTNARHWIQ